MSDIKGLLSHRKLMELKNSGVVQPYKFEEIAEGLYQHYIKQVGANLQKIRPSFMKCFEKLRAKRALVEARLMFRDRVELLEHLIVMEGESRFLHLSKGELDHFTLMHQASVGAERALAVLTCFKYSEQVIVDESTGFNVDWMLKNAYLLRSYLTEEGDAK